MNASALKMAHTKIAGAMGWGLAAWFIPVPVVGSMACNEVEKHMVTGIVDT